MHGTLRGDDDCAATREPTASPRISHFTVPLPLPLRDEYARSTNTETATIEQRSVRIARNHGEYRGRGGARPRDRRRVEILGGTNQRRQGGGGGGIDCRDRDGRLRGPRCISIT